MAIQSINPFAPAALEEKMFMGWETAISDKELAMKTATLRLYNIGAAVNTMEVEVAVSDDMPVGGKTGAWDIDDVADLSISADLAGKITNYAVLKIEDELVVVKSVNRTDNTIEVFKRGHGGTTPATHADQTDALITGYNYVVGVKDIESRVIGEDFNSYYVAKNTAPAVSFTKEDLGINRKAYGEAGQLDYVNSQIDKMDKELLISLNKSLIYHAGEKPADGNPWMAVGLIAEALTNWNIVTSFGAFTKSKLDVALTASRNKGGSADTIVCGAGVYDAIQNLAKDYGTIVNTPNRLNLILGDTVKAIVTKVGTLVPVLDINFPDDKVVICNSANLFRAPLVGFEAPWADRTVAQESTRNNQAFTVDSITQWATYYFNSNRDITILTDVSYSS